MIILFSRLEQIANTPDVRRSPRLTQRHARREDPFNALASITHSATLRPSLRSYSKPHEMEPVSILNESGQSVPLSFDMEADNSQKTGETSDRVVTSATDLPPHFFGMFGWICFIVTYCTCNFTCILHM